MPSAKRVARRFLGVQPLRVQNFIKMYRKAQGVLDRDMKTCRKALMLHEDAFMANPSDYLFVAHLVEADKKIREATTLMR